MLQALAIWDSFVTAFIAAIYLAGSDIDTRSTLVIALTEAMFTIITTRYTECDPA